MNNYYEKNNEYVTQIALYENDSIQTNGFFDLFYADFNFVTLSNKGELTIWSMLNFDSDKKLYKKVESLDLNCKSDYINSSIFFKGDRQV